MLSIFKKKDDKMMVVSMKHQIREAFSNVNYDMENIKQWVNHLAEKSRMIEDSHHSHRSSTQKDIENINLWIHYLNRHNQELQKYIREVTTNLLELHKRDTEIMERLKALEMHYEAQKSKSVSEPAVVEVRTKSGLKSGTGPAKTTKFEEKIMFQLKSKRKEYILNQILNFINGQSLSTKELEEKIVRELGLCGRTTFYDYLKELRHKKVIGDKDSGARKILVELSPVPD
jgi:Lhr-like helicase